MGNLKKAHGYDPIFMIGDGATDMEARPPADAFIGECYCGLACVTLVLGVSYVCRLWRNRGERRCERGRGLVRDGY